MSKFPGEPAMAFTTNRRQVLAAGGVAAALVASEATAATPPSGFDEVFDVVVVGSGAAGCVAALSAHEAGARVLVLEKAVVPGGTSAKSGGAVWIPNHPYLAAAKLDDPRDDFLKLAARSSFPVDYDPAHPTLGIPESSLRLLETFYENGAAMVSKLDAWKALMLEIYQPGGVLLPDYHAELPENKRPTHRMLQVKGRYPDGPYVGDELISQLTAALAARKIPLRTRHRVTDLIRNTAGEVVGVALKRGDEQGAAKIAAARGVVFATGGFAHNQELLDRFQYGPVFGGCAAPSSTGDIVPIAAGVGAKFGNMSCAWRAPVILDEVAQYISPATDIFMIVADSMLEVNLAGRRCGNEKRAYQDRTLTMYRWDEATGDYPDLIHIAVYDQRSAELFAGVMPIPMTPTSMDYVLTGKDLPELAARIDERLAQLADAARGARLDPTFATTLKASIERFNRFAETGVDEDFGRGSGTFDNFPVPPLPSKRWPKSTKPNPMLHPLTDEGPYYAIILAPGVLDTNGGPVIDPKARILDNQDRPIPGLFGAGNCIASPARDAYMAAGTTLGMAMTFGMIAGATSAAEPPRALS
jgi:3-oxosteroid 1-dehydrogenase